MVVTAATEHDPIFGAFVRSEPYFDGDGDHNFMGAVVAHYFERDLTDKIKSSGRSAIYDADRTYPHKDSEDYFEWVDLLTAIERAADRFTMIEVGAGYGRWITNAAAALRRCYKRQPPLARNLIGIEADAARFAMMERNCSDNGIDARDLQLIRAACMADDLPAFMLASDDYGARVSRDDMGRPEYFQKIAVIRLESLLTDPVDFLDMDIQGAEWGVVPACITQLNAAVKLIHIGTHSIEIDAKLAALFHAHGWRPRHLFTCGSFNETPYGGFQFIDGISSWENPRFD